MQGRWHQQTEPQTRRAHSAACDHAGNRWRVLTAIAAMAIWYRASVFSSSGAFRVAFPYMCVARAMMPISCKHVRSYQ